MDIEGSYISGLAPKRRIVMIFVIVVVFVFGGGGLFVFWGFFFNFLGIYTHNFVKNDLKLETKGLFYAKFYGEKFI